MFATNVESAGLVVSAPAGWIDPCSSRLCWRCWWLVDEAVWVVSAGPIESVLSGSVNGISLAVMDLVWRHEADAAKVVVVVVPVEELPAEGLDIAAVAAVLQCEAARDAQLEDAR